MPKINLAQRASKISKHLQKTRGVKFFKKRPLLIISLLFLLLIILIIAGNLLSNHKSQEELTQEAIAVNTYHIGEAPRVRILAKIDKEQVWRVYAQTGGVINKLYVFEGDSVYAGKTLAYIASNYAGANANLVQKDLAYKNLKFNQDNYDLQKDLINKQKEIAHQTDKNSDELQAIASESLNSTRDQINLSKEIITSLDEQISDLESLNLATQSADISALKSQKLQLMGGLTTLEQALLNTEYADSADNPPAQLSDLNKDLLLKQLELETKTLDLNKEISELNYKLASINASLSYPSSICNGIIQKVHVKRGQVIQPGTLLFTIKIEQGQTFATALVSKQIASNINNLENSYLNINSQPIAIKPDFVPTEATDGTSFAIKYAIPEEHWAALTDSEYIEISIPVGSADTNSSIPFLPIDSVYQNADKNFVFVAEDNIAKSKEVELGAVYGQFVNIISGLSDDQTVILDRNVVEGDLVKF